MKLPDIDHLSNASITKTAEEHESVMDSIMSGKAVPATLGRLQEDLNKIAAEHDKKKDEKKEDKKDDEKEEKGEKDEKGGGKDDKKERFLEMIKGKKGDKGKNDDKDDEKEEKKASAEEVENAFKVVLAQPAGADVLKLAYACGEFEAETTINEVIEEAGGDVKEAGITEFRHEHPKSYSTGSGVLKGALIGAGIGAYKAKKGKKGHGAAKGALIGAGIGGGLGLAARTGYEKIMEGIDAKKIS